MSKVNEEEEDGEIDNIGCCEKRIEERRKEIKIERKGDNTKDAEKETNRRKKKDE